MAWGGDEYAIEARRRRARTQVDRTLQLIRSTGCKSGLVFNPATPLDCLEYADDGRAPGFSESENLPLVRYVMDKVDIILLMSVNPGFGGQKFIPATLDKAKEARKLIDGVAWCDDAYAVMPDADALVIVTEWNQFRALDLARVRELMRVPLMIDLRNIYTLDEAREAGFVYHSIVPTFGNESRRLDEPGDRGEVAPAGVAAASG